jgi:hypothetical protein
MVNGALPIFFFSLQIAFLPVRSGQSLILEMKKAEG